MKNILIVDDEYLVRLGLKTIIDWASFGYTIAGEASNGKDAYDFFEKNRIDVIFMDIKMPVMDGLELLRKIRERDKKTKIIILSHYDEFSYAQEAIKLGAFRYILKTELTQSNLENVLRSLHFTSGDESPPAGDTPMPLSEWNECWEKLIGEYMLPTFHKWQEYESRQDLWEQPFSKSAIPPLQSSVNNCVVFSVTGRTTSLQNDAKEKFPKAMKILFDEAFGSLAGKWHYNNNDFQFAAIAFLDNQEADGEQFISEKINNPCMKIVKNVQQYYGVNFFIGVSSIGKTDNCWQLMQEAHKSRVNCFFTNKTFVNIFHAIAQPTSAAVQRSIKRVIIDYAKLVVYFDTNKKEAVLEYIQSIFIELRTMKNYKIVQEAFIDFLSVGKLIQEKYKIDEKALISDNMFKYDAFFDLLFIEDVERYVYELYLSLFFSKLNGQTNYSHIVKNCIGFIHSDYQNNIGLAEIAEKIGISPSYLSFIFKQEAGINFNTALTQYRIEKAKKLLLSTSLRIYQIAEQVGFQNPYYFSKVFEEISGYTCKEYRNKGGESFED